MDIVIKGRFMGQNFEVTATVPLDVLAQEMAKAQLEMLPTLIPAVIDASLAATPSVVDRYCDFLEHKAPPLIKQVGPRLLAAMVAIQKATQSVEDDAADDENPLADDADEYLSGFHKELLYRGVNILKEEGYTEHGATAILQDINVSEWQQARVQTIFQQLMQTLEDNEAEVALKIIAITLESLHGHLDNSKANYEQALDGTIMQGVKDGRYSADIGAMVFVQALGTELEHQWTALLNGLVAQGVSRVDAIARVLGYLRRYELFSLQAAGVAV